MRCGRAQWLTPAHRRRLRHLAGQNLHVPPDGVLGEHRGLLSRGDHGDRRGIAHDVRDLPTAIEHVDRHRDHTQLHARQPQIHDCGLIGEIEREAITALDATSTQRGRQLIAAPLEVAEGEAFNVSGNTFEFERWLCRATEQCPIKESQQ